jgi:hypothetical protein
MINNYREYPQLLSNAEYEAKMVISDCLVFDIALGVSKDYKNNKRIKNRPAKITEKYAQQPVIWVDNANNKIGFTAGNYSEIFGADSIKSFTIQNVLPAKGPGGAYLEVNLEDSSNGYAVYSGQSKSLDKFVNQIASLTQKEVKMGQEYHDC